MVKRKRTVSLELELHSRYQSDEKLSYLLTTPPHRFERFNHCFWFSIYLSRQTTIFSYSSSVPISRIGKEGLFLRRKYRGRKLLGQRLCQYVEANHNLNSTRRSATKYLPLIYYGSLEIDSLDKSATKQWFYTKPEDNSSTVLLCPRDHRNCIVMLNSQPIRDVSSRHLCMRNKYT